MTRASDVEFSLRDKVRDFIGEIAVVQANGETELEADPEVIRHFLPQGVGAAGYFHYQGVRVYEKGRKAEVEKAEAASHEERTFPNPIVEPKKA